MSEETSKEKIARAVTDLESIAEYAYSNGLHEFGYTPHETLLAEIQRLHTLLGSIALPDTNPMGRDADWVLFRKRKEERALANHGADLIAGRTYADTAGTYAAPSPFATQMDTSDSSPVPQQEIVSAIHHHAREIARLTEAWPAPSDSDDDGIGAGIPPDGVPRLPRLLKRCEEAIADLFEFEKVERDKYVGYPLWDRHNLRVVEVGELLADVRAALPPDDLAKAGT